MNSYRDFLARKGIQPLKIERTMKRGQDLVLLPVSGVETVPGPRGRFAGHCTGHRKAVRA